MEGGDKRRDFANIPLQSRATPTPQRSPLPSSQNNSFLRPDQQNRPTLRPQTSRPSIRISRLPSAQNVARTRPPPVSPATDGNDGTAQTGRRRSSSEPQRTSWPPRNDDALTRSATRTSYMEPVEEESSRTAAMRPGSIGADPTTPTPAGLAPIVAEAPGTSASASPNMLRRASAAFGSAIGFGSKRNSTATGMPNTEGVDADDEYESHLVDLLDVVDPEVSTLSTLTNVQNSLFVPNLGPFLNRRPTYTLSRRPSDRPTVATVEPLARPSTIHEVDTASTGEKAESLDSEPIEERPSVTRTTTSNTLSTISSRLSQSRYAVKPHGYSFEGWSADQKAELNDMVRHSIHSRRSKLKRGLRGFRQYIKKPLGFFVTLYATCITVFGLVWVLFLIGWINVGGRKNYDVNVIDNVLVALFVSFSFPITPFRIVDTYHMIYIAHYHYLTWRLRKEKALPKLQDENDLPSKRPADFDVEASADAATIAAQAEEKEELIVLTSKQQQKLQHHQEKFSNSHTFYKPHETESHHAFPIRVLLCVVVLLDCHSIFQIALGTCTWSISYHVRPFALTTVILCLSISCNIAGGVMISIGDRMTRKKDVIERMFRQELTEHAIHKIEKRKEKERKRNRDLDQTVEPVLEESEPGTPVTQKMRDPMERGKGHQPQIPTLRVVSNDKSLPQTPVEASSAQQTPVMERSRPVERPVYEGT